MCGGAVVIANCSHVGHIFRNQNPIKWSTPLGEKNYVRVALVWMDQYKNYFLERINYRLGDYGDITERLAIRDRLKCHDFGWYIDNVYPELRSQLVTNATYAGEFRIQNSQFCLDAMSVNHAAPELFGCHSLGGRQFWFLADEKYMHTEEKHVCTTSSGAVEYCRDNIKEEWSYDTSTLQLVSRKTGECLQKSGKGPNQNRLIMSPCQESSDLQKWLLERRKGLKEAYNN